MSDRVMMLIFLALAIVAIGALIMAWFSLPNGGI